MRQTKKGDQLLPKMNRILLERPLEPQVRHVSFRRLAPLCKQLPVHGSLLLIKHLGLLRGDERATIMKHLCAPTRRPGKMKHESVSRVKLSKAHTARRAVHMSAEESLEAMLRIAVVGEGSRTREHRMAL